MILFMKLLYSYIVWRKYIVSTLLMIDCLCHHQYDVDILESFSQFEFAKSQDGVGSNKASNSLCFGRIYWRYHFIFIGKH